MALLRVRGELHEPSTWTFVAFAVWFLPDRTTQRVSLNNPDDVTPPIRGGRHLMSQVVPALDTVDGLPLAGDTWDLPVLDGKRSTGQTVSVTANPDGSIGNWSYRSGSLDVKTVDRVRSVKTESQSADTDRR